MTSFYKHEQQYRTTPIIIASLCCYAFWGAAVWYGAPMLFLVICAVISALLSYNVILNPLSGIELNTHYLRVYSGRWERRVNVSDIKVMKVMRRGEGDDLFIVLLKNGKTVPMPDSCIGNTDRFAQVAGQIGIVIDIAERPGAILAKS